jgi:hypothetical protein
VRSSIQKRVLAARFAVLALLAVACAGPDKLARQSQEELSRGHTEKAYQKARKALDKEPGNEQARAAMTQAAVQLFSGYRERILGLAANGDTLSAAHRCLQLDGFRRELADHRVPAPADSTFHSQESRIRLAAAAKYYRQGQEELASSQPKRAYDDFLAARDLRPGYRDVESLIREAYAKAITRVAILPFEDQTGVRGLSMDLADKIYSEVSRRITPKDFRFTVLVSREDVYARTPVAALGRFDRADAIEVGRGIGADRIVTGRFYGLHSNTDTQHFTQRIFHRELEKGPDGKMLENWVERELNLVYRTRDVTVQYEFQVLSTVDGSVLATRTEELSARARTLFTEFQPRGECRDYGLYSPAMKKSDPAAASKTDESWQAHAGSWTVPELLQRAKDGSGRATYKPECRQEFYGGSSARPVFLGECPPEGDMAYVALDDVWRPVLAALRDLDK